MANDKFERFHILKSDTKKPWFAGYKDELTLHNPIHLIHYLTRDINQIGFYISDPNCIHTINISFDCPLLAADIIWHDKEPTDETFETTADLIDFLLLNFEKSMESFWGTLKEYTKIKDLLNEVAPVYERMRKTMKYHKEK